MANTLALRRRIRTAQNVSKTTRAMQMIAASKLKKAQEAVLASRPYVNHLVAISKNILLQKSQIDKEDMHPYLIPSSISKKTLYVFISPDKGLCGGLVTNLTREYVKYPHDSSLFITVGKKIEGMVASTTKNLIGAFPYGNTLPSFSMVFPILSLIDEYFLTHKVDQVKIVTTHFKNIFTQTPFVINLLPITLETVTSFTPQATTTLTSSVLFEPNASALLPSLLKRYSEMVLYQQLLESYASEQASRMIAMQNATNNAKDIVASLQLLYNKARQEKITNEILDISSATIALSGGNL